MSVISEKDRQHREAYHAAVRKYAMDILVGKKGSRRKKQQPMDLRIVF